MPVSKEKTERSFQIQGGWLDAFVATDPESLHLLAHYRTELTTVSHVSMEAQPYLRLLLAEMSSQTPVSQRASLISSFQPSQQAIPNLKPHKFALRLK